MGRITRKIGESIDFVDGKGFANLSHEKKIRLLFKTLAEREDRLIELEKENEIFRDSLEWLQREINNLGETVQTESGYKLILERPEKTKHVIFTALNYNNQ